NYDALSEQNGADFTVNTYKKGKHEDACLRETLTGGWWFKKCNNANLNGRKIDFVLLAGPRGITWHKTGDMKSYSYTYDKVEMKIRDADFGFCRGSLKS
ncbi:carcinolectin 5A isoform, putative, partial [Ixodes scapularis]